MGSSDSDSSDDKRVVRSAKDRRYDELRSTCDEIRVRGVSVQLSCARFACWLSFAQRDRCQVLCPEQALLAKRAC